MPDIERSPWYQHIWNRTVQLDSRPTNLYRSVWTLPLLLPDKGEFLVTSGWQQVWPQEQHGDRHPGAGRASARGVGERDRRTCEFSCYSRGYGVGETRFSYCCPFLKRTLNWLLCGSSCLLVRLEETAPLAQALLAATRKLLLLALPSLWRPLCCCPGTVLLSKLGLCSLLLLDFMSGRLVFFPDFWWCWAMILQGSHVPIQGEAPLQLWHLVALKQSLLWKLTPVFLFWQKLNFSPRTASAHLILALLSHCSPRVWQKSYALKFTSPFIWKSVNVCDPHENFTFYKSNRKDWVLWNQCFMCILLALTINFVF